MHSFLTLRCAWCLTLCISTLHECVRSDYSHAKLAPGWALMQVNFDPIQEIGMEWAIFCETTRHVHVAQFVNGASSICCTTGTCPQSTYLESHSVHTCTSSIVSFPGLPTVQFLITCSMQKRRGRPGPFYHVNDVLST